MKRIIVGISGASGVIYGIRLLEMLKEIKGVESHLVMTNGAKLNISLETDFDSKAFESKSVSREIFSLAPLVITKCDSTPLISLSISRSRMP